MKQHTLTHKSHEIAAAAAAAAARAGGADPPEQPDQPNNGSSSASDGRPDSVVSGGHREDSNSSPLLEAGLKRSPAEDSSPASAEPLPKRLHGKQEKTNAHYQRVLRTCLNLKLKCINTTYQPLLTTNLTGLTH